LVNGYDDADEARWFPLNDLPPLAFDHDEIIEKGLELWGMGN
jgi:8-oxo-dGTP diphosphatase